MNNLKQNSAAGFQKTAALSLVSITLAGIITSAHHLYRLGFEVLIPALVIVFVPYLLMRWYRRSGSKLALWFYGVLNVLVISWFGVIDGFADHVVKAFGRYILTPLTGESVKIGSMILPPYEGDFFYEITGILTFIASAFATYYGIKMIRGRRQMTTSQQGLVAKIAATRND